VAAESSALAAQRIRGWRTNVAKFAWDNFRMDPDPWQRQLFDAFPSQDPLKIRIALRACAGPGKTAGLAVCGWNAISCYGGRGLGNFKGAAVSISADNLRDNLWAEFSKWQEKSEFLKQQFVWTSRRIYAKDNPEGRFIAARAFARSATQEQQAQTLSGLHAEFVLILIDESGDIPLPIMQKGEQAMASARWGKILQAGNPTGQAGMLYAAATNLAHLWYNIVITADPDRADRSTRIDRAWAEEQIRTHGRLNPWVMSYILGEFPPTALNCLLSPEEVEKAMQRSLNINEYSWAQKRIGIDVARFGDDSTTICPRQGLALFEPVIMRNADGPAIAARVAVGRQKWGSEKQFVDDTGGYGASVQDSLRLAEIPIIPVNFSSSAPDPGFFNMRSYIHWQLAALVKRGAMLPNIPQFKRELTTPVYWYEKGKIRIEEKDQIKKRLGFSPDISDGFATTFALPDQPGRANDPIQAAIDAVERNRVEGDFDPYKEQR
jgi:phage terminase large subunit